MSSPPAHTKDRLFVFTLLHSWILILLFHSLALIYQTRDFTVANFRFENQNQHFSTENLGFVPCLICFDLHQLDFHHQLFFHSTTKTWIKFKIENIYLNTKYCWSSLSFVCQLWLGLTWAGDDGNGPKYFIRFNYWGHERSWFSNCEFVCTSSVQN